MTARISKLAAYIRSATGKAVFDSIMETAPSFLLVADSDGIILRQSRFVADITGEQPHAAEGLTVAEYWALHQVTDPQGRPLKLEELSLVRALKGEHVRGMEGSFIAPSGERIPFVVNSAPIRTPDGEVIGAISATTDLRHFKALEIKLRTAADEKEMLYRELTHRVKNHLQIMSGLIKLEARDAKTVAEMAERMSGRVIVLAEIYRTMMQAETGGRIEARAFIEKVVGPYRTASISIDVTAPENLTLSPDAAGPLGMLVNEAVANSYKHAFPDHRCGRIDVRLRPSPPDRLELTITDDGIGWAAPTDQPSQGLTLMRLLAEQLGGEIEASARLGGGWQVVVSLPISLVENPHGGPAQRRSGAA